ncbi:hypothetical protein [Actinocatenispora rupis]|uniref:Uncharacterized protein n=1 Tax=Actinocatenispora rupis TaxID=519421 RepID=A0A8J3IUM3_9ACTN|nr:hypothetical protein [Actinocatenispora rupis]GID10211.1 hypothetical protein Aru02nite_11000 [Actinocatenispora rupis]
MTDNDQNPPPADDASGSQTALRTPEFVQIGHCPPGWVVTCDTAKLLVVGPADDGIVPAATFDGGLHSIPADTTVCTERLSFDALVIAELYRQLQRAGADNTLLADKLIQADADRDTERSRFQQTLASIREAVIEHYRTNEELTHDAIEDFLISHGMPPLRHRVEFTLHGSYLIDADSLTAEHDAEANLTIDLSRLAAGVVADSLGIDDRDITVDDASDSY